MLAVIADALVKLCVLAIPFVNQAVLSIPFLILFVVHILLWGTSRTSPVMLMNQHPYLEWYPFHKNGIQVLLFCYTLCTFVFSILSYLEIVEFFEDFALADSTLWKLTATVGIQATLLVSIILSYLAMPSEKNLFMSKRSYFTLGAQPILYFAVLVAAVAHSALGLAIGCAVFSIALASQQSSVGQLRALAWLLGTGVLALYVLPFGGIEEDFLFWIARRQNGNSDFILFDVLLWVMVLVLICIVNRCHLLRSYASEGFDEETTDTELLLNIKSKNVEYLKTVLSIDRERLLMLNDFGQKNILHILACDAVFTPVLETIFQTERKRLDTLLSSVDTHGRLPVEEALHWDNDEATRLFLGGGAPTSKAFENVLEAKGESYRCDSYRKAILSMQAFFYALFVELRAIARELAVLSLLILPSFYQNVVTLSLALSFLLLLFIPQARRAIWYGLYILLGSAFVLIYCDILFDSFSLSDEILFGRKQHDWILVPIVSYAALSLIYQTSTDSEVELDIQPSRIYAVSSVHKSFKLYQGLKKKYFLLLNEKKKNAVQSIQSLHQLSIPIMMLAFYAAVVATALLHRVSILKVAMISLVLFQGLWLLLWPTAEQNLIEKALPFPVLWLTSMYWNFLFACQFSTIASSWPNGFESDTAFGCSVYDNNVFINLFLPGVAVWIGLNAKVLGESALEPEGGSQTSYSKSVVTCIDQSMFIVLKVLLVVLSIIRIDFIGLLYCFLLVALHVTAMEKSSFVVFVGCLSAAVCALKFLTALPFIEERQGETWGRFGLISDSNPLASLSGVLPDILLFSFCVVDSIVSCRAHKFLNETANAKKEEETAFQKHLRRFFSLFLPLSFYVLLFAAFEFQSALSVVISFLALYIASKSSAYISLDLSVNKFLLFICLVSFYLYTSSVLDEDISRLTIAYSDFIGLTGVGSSDLSLYFVSLLFLTLWTVHAKPLERKAFYDPIVRFSFLAFLSKLLSLLIVIVVMVRISILGLPILILATYSFASHSLWEPFETFWSHIHIYSAVLLTLLSLFQLPWVDDNFGLKVGYLDFSWSSLIGLEKVSTSSNYLVATTILAFILIDILRYIHLGMKHSASAAPVKGQAEKETSKEGKQCSRLLSYRIQEANLSSDVDTLLSQGGNQSISWHAFSDSEIWPYSFSQSPPVVNDDLDLSAAGRNILLLDRSMTIIQVSPAMNRLLLNYLGEICERASNENSEVVPEWDISLVLFLFPFDVQEEIRNWHSALCNEDAESLEQFFPVSTILLDPCHHSREKGEIEPPHKITINLRAMLNQDYRFHGVFLEIQDVLSPELRQAQRRKSIVADDTVMLDLSGYTLLLNDAFCISTVSSGISRLLQVPSQKITGVPVSSILQGSSEKQKRHFFYYLHLCHFDVPVHEMKFKLVFSTMPHKNETEEQKHITCETSVKKVNRDGKVQYQVTLKPTSMAERLSTGFRRLIETLNTTIEAKSDQDLVKVYRRKWHNPLVALLQTVSVFLLSKSSFCLYALLFLKLLITGSFVDMVIPFSILTYALLEFPRPPTSYWKTVMCYLLFIILLKVLFQLSLFCTDTITGDYALQPLAACSSDTFYEITFETRRDFVLGIHKAIRGNVVKYVIMDLFCLAALFLHREKLATKGLWSNRRAHPATPEPVLLKKANQYFAGEESKNDMLIHRMVSRVSMHDSVPSQLQLFAYRLVPVDPLQRDCVDEELKPGRDLYTPVFILDLISLIYSILFWSFLTSASESSSSAFANSRFPAAMVGFIVAQILFMLLDRYMYTKKSLPGKLLLHVSNIIFFHLFVFSLWPRDASVSFSASAALVVFYLIRLGSLLVSTAQIQGGYPSTKIDHNFMTKDTKPHRKIIVTVFYAIPLLYELRTTINWMLVDTALTLREYFTFEDVYFKVYLAKCELENEYGDRERGVARPSRCLPGCGMITAIMILLVGPLVLFSDLNPQVQLNNVDQVDISLRVTDASGYSIGLLGISSNQDLSVVSASTYSSLLQQGLISNSDDINTVQNIRLSPFSDTAWDASAAARDSFANRLAGDQAISFDIVYTLSQPSSVPREVIKSRKLTAVEKTELIDFVNADITMSSRSTLEISGLFPTFIELPRSGSLRPNIAASTSANLVYTTTGTSSFWSLEAVQDPEEGVSFVTLSDESIPGVSSDGGSGYAIVTFYVGVVVTIGNFVRLQTSDQMYSIIYDEMLNVDDILLLCEGVYLARYNRNFKKEETIYRLLIRIFRSPEGILGLTRRKK